MARALRITFPDAFYHVTSRGNERKYLKHRSNMTSQAINFINVKMYLCQRYSGKKLKEIGLHFGSGESGVSPACRRVAQ